MKAVLVTASREWQWRDVPVFRARLGLYPAGTILIHGGARGGDWIAGKLGEEMGFQVEEFPVTEEDWKAYGLRAGPIRNGRMVARLVQLAAGGAECHVEGFPLGRARGTRDCLRTAKREAGKLNLAFPIKFWVRQE